MRALAEVSARTVEHLARAKWHSSGLSDADAKTLKLKALRAQKVRALSGRFHEAGALLIPYFDLDGRSTKFYRIRYLEKLPGVAGAALKPQRYDQLPVMQEAYYPPLLDVPWSEVSSDPTFGICVTEGELKAACACACGIPMMALGGVYSFMSGKRGVDLLPSMKRFRWEGRKVAIAYDNDVSTKVEVMRAMLLLAERLLAEGAEVSYVTIPPGPAKGVDDYIVKHGSEAFEELITKAEPYLEGTALWTMNQEVVLIKNDGVPIVVERSTGTAMSPDVFERVMYANHHHMVQVVKGTGRNQHVILEKAQTAKRWVEWERRAELDKLVYEPGMPKVTSNSWNGWEGWGVSPKRGEMRPWHDLMDFLFMKDASARKYFEQWCAYPIQNPGAKLYTATLLWSRVKRLGKSMAFIALGYVYGDNAIIIDSKQLKSGFNSWAKNRQLVVGEEITAGEARVDADWLKGTITNPTFTINSKFKAEYTIRNCMNFGFLSNHPDALFIEDGDHRYFVHEVLQNSPATRGFYEKINSWLHRDGDPAKGAGAGPPCLMEYLLKLDLRGFNPREHAPETRGKLEMIRSGKSDCALWVTQLQEDAPSALRAVPALVRDSCDLYDPEQLYRAFDPEGRGRGRTSLSGLGRALSAAGFRQVNGGVPVTTDAGLKRLYAIRNVVKWEQATRAEIRAHYNEHFGPRTAGEVK